MYSQIFRYIRKVFYLSIPFFLFLALYIYLDPLKVVWHYDNYYENDAHAHFSINQGYVSVSNFDNHYPEFQWDSYIFGNSRSRYWPVADWVKYLPSDSKACHMDAHSETLLGLLSKIEYVDEHANKLNNALLVIDNTILANTQNRNDYLFSLPPQLAGKKTWLTFQVNHFTSFCDKQFLQSFLFYKFINTPEIPDDIIHLESFDYAYSTNEISYDEYEKQIAEDAYYTPKLVKRFFSGDQYPDSVANPTIKQKQIEMLQKIKTIFDKRKTDYRIVINPIYDQVRMSPEDLEQLYKIFGQNQVFDFSGKNQFTSDYHNYYEHSHYRPVVSKQIMDSIYNIQNQL